MTVYLGTSGWQYAHWRDTFYPKGTAQTKWLDFYFERFQIVELNVTFYRLPKEETFAKWYAKTPDDFVFAAKVSRYLTHIKKLQEPEEPVRRYMKHVRHLREKLGPVLIQLPPTLKVDVENLDRTLRAFPPGLRIAVEPRHESWWTDEVRAVLERHRAALCLADRGEKPVTPVWKTADWAFLRFHSGSGKPSPCYRKKALVPWVERLTEHWGTGSDSYVFFNNDPRACALRDAIWFHDLMQQAGHQVTRVPPRSDVFVGDVETAAWAREHPTGRDERRYSHTMP
ncbi:MAG TPA: DUF72 domain-containing protein [Actinomycetota bacterium]|nr:DUF72 domain-containing protein [Actinomycetota bacterium]